MSNSSGQKTDLIAPNLPNALSPVGIGLLIDRFIAAQDVRSSSRATYQRSLKPFFVWMTTAEVYQPTRDDILAYKRHLEVCKLSSLTLSSYMVVVRKFFEWAESMKLYPNVAKGVKGSKRAKGFRKDPLTVLQIKSLLTSIDLATSQGLRDFSLLNLLVRTGLRTIEAVRSDIGDIRQQAGETVLWIHGKGRDMKDEFVLLTEEALQPLYEYLATRGRTAESMPLFASLSPRNLNGRLTTRSVSRIVKENLKGMGINHGRLTAHSLRHTAITLSLQGGATIQEAQTLGRHQDINTTMVYAHNISRIEQAPEKKIATFLKESFKANSVNTVYINHVEEDSNQYPSAFQQSKKGRNGRETIYK